jgi:hypothetical protein
MMSIVSPEPRFGEVVAGQASVPEGENKQQFASRIVDAAPAQNAGHLQRKRDLAIEVLVQAVVAAAS